MRLYEGSVAESDEDTTEDYNCATEAGADASNLNLAYRIGQLGNSSSESPNHQFPQNSIRRGAGDVGYSASSPSLKRQNREIVTFSPVFAAAFATICLMVTFGSRTDG